MSTQIKLDNPVSDLQNHSEAKEASNTPITRASQIRETLRCVVSMLLYAGGLFIMAWGKLIEHNVWAFLLGSVVLGSGVLVFLLQGKKPTTPPTVCDKQKATQGSVVTTVKRSMARNDAKATNQTHTCFHDMMIYFKM